MTDKTIDVLLNVKHKGVNETVAGSKRVEKSLKDIETQANRTRERMQKLQMVGRNMAFLGAAILAPFALAMNKYVSTAKEAEEKRSAAIEKAIEKAKDLEKERLDVVKDTSEKIKAIDETLAEKRASLVERVLDAEQKIADVRKSLKNTLQDIAESREDEELSYKRQLEDISLIGVEISEESRKEIQLQRAKEDHERKLAEFAQKEKEARQKAAEEVRRIQKEEAREREKINIEIAKLEEQKRANREAERVELERIAKAEKQAIAERQAAETKRSKTLSGILEASERWQEIQLKIGEITTKQVLPALEIALDIMERITAFAEKNPGAIKAALGIGGTLVVLGGLISGAASIVQTLATVQGFAAGLGIGGSAAGGTSALLAGLGPVLMAVMTNPLTWAVLALLLVKPILNALLGTNQTWEDIATTGKQALFLVGYGIDKVIRSVGSFFSNMGNSIVSALQKAATFMVEGIGGGIARLLGLAPHKAMGGYMPTGLYNVSEGGKREFALSHSTTRAAEQVIGGSLSQGRLLAALAGGGGKRITYQDHRRIDASLSMSQRRAISNDVMSALTGAI